MTAAITLHRQWRQRLLGALILGQGSFTLAEVADATRCDFGRWLHAMPDAIKSTSQWRQVEKIHREFHDCAALVFDLTLKGHRREAAVLLEPGGLFAESETNLTNALNHWRRHLGAAD